MSEVHLEPLDASNLDAVLRIEQRVYPHPWTHGNFLDALRSGYHMRVLLGGDAGGEKNNETLLGYYVAMQGVDEAHLLNITVAPEHQGQGFARLMLDALDLWARGIPAQQLWLEVRAGNVRAIRLYETHGYQRQGLRKGYYPDGHGRREDAVVMRLKL